MIERGWMGMFDRGVMGDGKGGRYGLKREM